MILLGGTHWANFDEKVHKPQSVSDSKKVQKCCLFLMNLNTSKAKFTQVSTLISLINVEPTITDFEKFHPPQNKNPPSTFIDFLDFSTLHSSFIRVMY